MAAKSNCQPQTSGTFQNFLPPAKHFFLSTRVCFREKLCLNRIWGHGKYSLSESGTFNVKLYCHGGFPWSPWDPLPAPEHRFVATISFVWSVCSGGWGVGGRYCITFWFSDFWWNFGQCDVRSGRDMEVRFVPSHFVLGFTLGSEFGKGRRCHSLSAVILNQCRPRDHHN